MPIVLETTGLRKRFIANGQEVDVLQGIDFRVQKGEFVAVMGPSGSGKSILLHLIGGLEKPTDGEVFLAGKRLSILDEKDTILARRRSVGFVFQVSNLISTLTVEENILLPVMIDGQDKRRYADRLDKLLRLVGLTLRRGQKPDQLSASEQRRVTLARAMITQPAIVLADEPASDLDSKTATSIMEMLRRSCDELSQTILMVTRDPRFAAFADRVVFLRDGHFVAQVDLKEVAQSERLQQVVAAPEQYQV